MPFFESLVWLDLGLNPGLPDHWRTLYALGQWHRRYERVYFFLLSVLGDTRRKTQILKVYANHTMLTPHAQRILWCLRSLFISVVRDPNWSVLIRSEKLHDSTVENPTKLLFKILKFSGPSLPGMTSSTHSIHSNGRPALFPVGGGVIMTDDDCHILSVRA